MKDDDFAIEAVRKKQGASALEQQKAFYDNLYGGKSPEEIQAAAKANYDKIHNKNVNNTLGSQQFNQAYSEKLETLRATPKLDVPVVGFDFGKKLAEKATAVTDDKGATGTGTGTGTPTPSHELTHAATPDSPKAQSQAQGVQAEGRTIEQPKDVVVDKQTVNHEEAVDDQKKAATGGVANTFFQNDGDEKVSIKEQDKSFEAKSAYTSNFGDNAGAKGAVTAAGSADSGYSGGDEQPNKGQK